MEFELLDALEDRFRSTRGHDSAWWLTRGRYYVGIAPEEAKMPYVTLHWLDASPSYQMTDGGAPDHWERAVIQVNCFSNKLSVEEICKLATAVRALFDKATLTVTDHTHCGVMLRQHQTPPMRDPDNEVWQVNITYNVTIQPS